MAADIFLMFYIGIHVDGIYRTSYKNDRSMELHFFTPFSAIFMKSFVASRNKGVGLITMNITNTQIKCYNLRLIDVYNAFHVFTSPLGAIVRNFCCF